MIRRHISPHVQAALADTPVVAIHGPRQCGKTTLARELAPDFPYVTLDDPLSLESAIRTPASFLAAHPDHVVIDEIQRAPNLFRAIKAEVDRDRRPGRFLLTGSANVMLLPKMSDSLAGRMEAVPLYPLAQAEIVATGSNFVDRIFAERFRPGECEPADWDGLARRGGFPEPVGRATSARREAWFSAYVKALIERDIRDLADIDGLRALPSLLRALARQTGDALNVTALARETGIPATSVQRYISLLEAVYLVRLIPAWTLVKTGKVAKTAKVAFLDSGLHSHLSGTPNLANFVSTELIKQASWAETPVEVRHFRSLTALSVPIVLQSGDGRLVGIVVIDRERAESGDQKALAFLKEVAGPAFLRGIVITTGNRAVSYTDQLSEIGLAGLWQG